METGQKDNISVFFRKSLVAGEAALAADLITAWKTRRGGCASRRLDHGFPEGLIHGVVEQIVGAKSEA